MNRKMAVFILSVLNKSQSPENWKVLAWNGPAKKENEMKYRNIVILLLVAVLLAASVTTTRAAPIISISSTEKYAANPGDYDYTTHGTDWVNETPAKVAFSYKGWGTIARAKTTAGQYWVHIPISYPSVIAGSAMKIKYVEFCAQSTNGAATKPIQMDLWEYPGKFLTVGIAWPADNAKHCFGYTFTTPAWRQDLGISVLLNFANTVDKITLYKAWVRITP